MTMTDEHTDTQTFESGTFVIHTPTGRQGVVLTTDADDTARGVFLFDQGWRYARTRLGSLTTEGVDRTVSPTMEDYAQAMLGKAWEMADDDPSEELTQLRSRVATLEALNENQAAMLRERRASTPDEVETLRAQLARQTEQTETWAGRYHQLSTTHDEFRAQVREVAMRVAEEQSWCDTGLNGVLDELGLDRKYNQYRVSVQVTATQTVWVSGIEAGSEDEAIEYVQQNYDDDNIDGFIDRYGWTIDSWETDGDAEYDD